VKLVSDVFSIGVEPSKRHERLRSRLVLMPSRGAIRLLTGEIVPARRRIWDDEQFAIRFERAGAEDPSILRVRRNPLLVRDGDMSVDPILSDQVRDDLTVPSDDDDLVAHCEDPAITRRAGNAPGRRYKLDAGCTVVSVISCA
jgi:hypothetical protein